MHGAMGDRNADNMLTWTLRQRRMRMGTERSGRRFSSGINLNLKLNKLSKRQMDKWILLTVGVYPIISALTLRHYTI